MAGARFQRNQRLIAEIFNEVCIPDLRTNVSVDRILTLRRQVNALKTHRDTFEKDLKDLEEKHAEKKRKFTDANEKFYSEYAEASASNLSQEKINEILQKYATMEKLQKEKQLLLQQQQQQAAAAAAVAAPPPPSTIPSSSTATTTAVTPPITTTVSTTTPTNTVTASETTTPTVVKTESEFIAEVFKEEPAVTPPPSVPIQTPPLQPVAATVAHNQSVPSPLPPPPSTSTQLPPTQPVLSQVPPSQPLTQPQISQPPSGMVQMPVQQQHPSAVPPAAQGYPMMQSGGGYAPTPGYGHPQQTPYRPMMNQRPVQYPANVQWSQQPPQQWQTNTYGNISLFFSNSFSLIAVIVHRSSLLQSISSQCSMDSTATATTTTMAIKSIPTTNGSDATSTTSIHAWSTSPTANTHVWQ